MDVSTLKKDIFEDSTFKKILDRNAQTTANIPSWIYDHWKHTYDYKLPGISEKSQPDDLPVAHTPERVGGCVAVGMNGRLNQLQAVDCNNEVADVVCQPNL